LIASEDYEEKGDSRQFIEMVAKYELEELGFAYGLAMEKRTT